MHHKTEAVTKNGKVAGNGQHILPLGWLIHRLEINVGSEFEFFRALTGFSAYSLFERRFFARVLSCNGVAIGSKCLEIRSKFLPNCSIPRASKLSSLRKNFTLFLSTVSSCNFLEKIQPCPGSNSGYVAKRGSEIILSAVRGGIFTTKTSLFILFSNGNSLQTGIAFLSRSFCSSSDVIYSVSIILKKIHIEYWSKIRSLDINVANICLKADRKTL